MLDRIALILTIIGALNWGRIVSRIIYVLVGLAGLWCISLLFRERNIITDGEDRL